MLSNLKKLMDPKFKFPCVSGGKVKFCDKAAAMKVVATEFPEDAVLMKCPDNQQGFLWKGDKDRPEGYTQICDYLVFLQKSQVVHVFFCELKTTADYPKAAGQMKHTKPLLRYIIAALETHFNAKCSIEMHHVLLYKKETLRAGKQVPHTGRRRKTPVDCDGIKIHRLVGEEVSFKKILAFAKIRGEGVGGRKTE